MFTILFLRRKLIKYNNVITHEYKKQILSEPKQTIVIKNC